MKLLFLLLGYAPPPSSIFFLLIHESWINLLWISHFYYALDIAFNYHNCHFKGKDFFNCYSKIQFWIKNRAALFLKSGIKCNFPLVFHLRCFDALITTNFCLSCYAFQTGTIIVMVNLCWWQKYSILQHQSN